MNTHAVISDTQVKPGAPLKHIELCGKLIADRMPNKIIMLGDWWDMPSLSLYDMGKISSEGARYTEDIDVGNEAMGMLLGPIHWAMKKRRWKPDFDFIMGNHEYRILRHVASHKHLEGKLSYKDFYLDGWKVHDFLEIAKIDGVHYSHYFANPMTGKPLGGTIQNMLNKLGYSFTMGHVQKLDFGRKDLTNGNVHMGLITGSYYMHDEKYKGPQGNYHWRGICFKHGVKNGRYDLETYSLERIMREYK